MESARHLLWKRRAGNRIAPLNTWCGIEMSAAVPRRVTLARYQLTTTGPDRNQHAACPWQRR